VGIIETIFGRGLFISYSRPPSFFKFVFLGRAVIFTTLEVVRPARTFSYLPVIARDLAAYVAFRCAILPVVIYLNNIVPAITRLL